MAFLARLIPRRRGRPARAGAAARATAMTPGPGPRRPRRGMGADAPRPVRPLGAGILLLPRSSGPPGVPERPARRDGQEMTGRRMPPAGKRADRIRSAPGPALALLPPPHGAVHVRARPARYRRRPRAAHRGWPAPGAHQQPWDWRATGNLPASCPRAAPRRPRPGRGQRPRSQPPTAPGHQPDDRHRPPAGRAGTQRPRKHQARARYHHYQGRLRAAPP